MTDNNLEIEGCQGSDGEDFSCRADLSCRYDKGQPVVRFHGTDEVYVLVQSPLNLCGRKMEKTRSGVPRWQSPTSIGLTRAQHIPASGGYDCIRWPHSVIYGGLCVHVIYGLVPRIRLMFGLLPLLTDSQRA
jgi:hypothetical protein